MSSSDNLPEPPPRSRATRTEREETSRVLSDALADGQLTPNEFDERSAVVWNATYSDELTPLLADLSPAEQPSAGVPASRYERYRITSSAKGSALSGAVFGGTDLKGPLTIARKHTSIAVFGGTEINLCEANFVSEETEIYCMCVFGGITIIVPDDVQVLCDGVGILGGFEQNAKGSTVAHPAPDAPIVRVRGAAIFGGVEIIRKPRIIHQDY